MKKSSFPALFDTGADTTIFNMEVIQMAKEAGKIIRMKPASEVDLTLRAAGGQELKIEGAYLLDFEILGRRIQTWGRAADSPALQTQ